MGNEIEIQFVYCGQIEFLVIPLGPSLALSLPLSSAFARLSSPLLRVSPEFFARFLDYN